MNGKLAAVALGLTLAILAVVEVLSPFLLSIASTMDDPGAISLRSAATISVVLVLLLHLGAALLVTRLEGLAWARSLLVAVGASVLSFAAYRAGVWAVAQMPDPIWQAMGSDPGVLVTMLVWSVTTVLISVSLSRAFDAGRRG